MKPFVVTAGLLCAALSAAILSATVARAENAECSEESMQSAIGEEAARAMANERGWKVSAIKIDDNCYVIKGTDQEGLNISVDVDPNSLVIENFDYLDKNGKPIPAEQLDADTGKPKKEKSK